MIEAYSHYKSVSFDFKQMLALDPSYIEARFQNELSPTVKIVTACASALAAAGFLIPMFQVSWILSHGGKRHLTVHIFICVIACAGGMCELIANFMLMGAHTTLAWLRNEFNLSDWNETDSNDGIGWRVIEVVRLAIEGMTMWINAFEWISVFFIMTMIFFTTNYERKHDANLAFGYKWSVLGLAIGILGLFEFIAELLRFVSWRTFSTFTIIIRIINMWVLVPTWLYVLGKQLPVAKLSFEHWKATTELKPLNVPSAVD
eukprot:CAMPEP_0113323658 /NCGR_PEP_ID=MMETSP0010_2-20120614/16473_1 /TAXON_ID=216773 ORGANISM="Corethron hystrix, Strain 308" /NCGR_SAMPLE_ID=MMETSP0010_2 /ASSEMBLY_ACC=CAM_ASM_000155 /LENGTH=259 /DNA_ID=CAMNT_0000182673 /DNA_START=289 /DNA_END=1068 /DNA_ORIENTATION=- /assembly_acc=CAM_ASM_000155